MKKFVSIGDVKSGQVLASDVTDARGQQLARAGLVLDQTWIDRLKGREVTRIAIEVEGGGSGRSWEDVEALHKSMFEQHAEDPVVSQIGEDVLPILKSRHLGGQA